MDKKANKLDIQKPSKDLQWGRKKRPAKRIWLPKENAVTAVLNKMGTELIENPKFKFSNNEEGPEPNFRNKKISDECLEEVFTLDNFLW